MSIVLWFAGLLGMIAAAAVASGRGRATPNDVSGRGALAIAAVAYAALVAAGIWTWGGALATEARSDRLREGASVQITMRGMRVPLDATLSLGHGARADVHVPGEGPDEIAQIARDGDDVTVRVAASGSEVRGREVALVVADGQDPAALATAHHCAPDRAPKSLAPGGAVIAIECDGGKPLRALVVRRDREKPELVVSPLAWHGRFVPERMLVRAGDVMRLGGGEALPGVTTWEQVAYHHATSVIAVPADPTDCGTWTQQRGAAHATADGCQVDADTFAISTLAFVPDSEAVIDRAARAVFAICVPPLLLLCALIASPRRGRRASAVGRALRIGVLGASLAALVCWRLVWAYRIDVMRELVAVGPRVSDNMFAAVAIGAALAGNCALALDALDGRGLVRRALAATVAWGAWLAFAIGVAGVSAPSSTRALGVLALSFAGVLVPLLGGAVGRRTVKLGPGVALLAIALGGLVARAVVPRAPLVKLGLAYALVLAGHAALRAMLGRDTSLPRRLLLGAGLAAAAAVLARYDAGVTLAIAGTGLALAMSVAGHDAAYDASQASRIGVLEREHARLIALHAAAAIALAIGVSVTAFVADDRTLIEHGTLAVLHAPLVMAVLFALAAAVAHSHRRGWAPWIAAALAALAVWGARDGLLERATAGDGVGSRRVSAVVEPGYALLRDERAFAASASAWREAAAPDHDVDRWTGQGYFGAQIRDPGVSRSIDNDYLPVLVAREGGVGGLARTIVLLLAIAVGAGVIASVRLRHASREHRARWLVTAVVGALAVYQPIASLGIFPLTGISWPGLGIDSPADLWLFALGAIWCVMGGEGGVEDERMRKTPRLARARAIALVALGVCSIAAVVLVARAGTCALGRAAVEDRRIDDALAYVATIACPWPEHDGASVGEVIPDTLASEPRDAGTTRFDRDLRAAWAMDRARIVGTLAPRAEETHASATVRESDDDGVAAAMAPLQLAWRAPVASRAVAGGAPIAVTPVNEPLSPDASTKATEKGSKSKPSTSSAKGTKGTAKHEHDSKRADDRSALDEDDDAPDGKAEARSSTQSVRAARVAPGAGGGRVATENCRGRAGRWRLAADGDECVATFRMGWPEVKLAIRPSSTGVHATCAVTRNDDVIAALRAPVRTQKQSRIRIVSAALGAAASDVGEIVIGQRVVRLRPDAPAAELAKLTDGLHVAGSVGVAPEVMVQIRKAPAGVVLQGVAELFVAEPGAAAAWRRVTYKGSVDLDRVTLIVAGSNVVLFRPARAWGGATTSDTLLADDSVRAGDQRTRRAYPYGSAMPELGWVNPFEVEHSLGLDGWVHAALARPSTTTQACGTLAPPAIARDRVCSPNPHDGVMECRVTVQPELTFALRSLADDILREPKPRTGKDVSPVRAAFVVLRGDTGELLAQGNVVPGRPALAYAPADAAAEAELVRLREDRAESDRERVEWNLPIAVGSTFKPVVARAAEQAFPKLISSLSLTAEGHGGGCKSRRTSIDPILGHCPPTSLASPSPQTSDFHDFLAHSPNWYQAALGVLGLGLPDATLSVGKDTVAFTDVIGSDLASWSADKALAISDSRGAIMTAKSVVVDGMRRTPLWTRVEALLGRPLCTLGDRAHCERAAARADVCAARALPIAAPTSDLRYLVALGPDRVDLYASDREKQSAVPVREYLQLLRGSGVHAVGSLAQITDAFGRVIYDPSETPKLAASWFPAPATGVLPDWSCTAGHGHAQRVLGADGGLCAVVQPGGTGYTLLGDVLADPKIIVYGAKTGTIDSLADIARKPEACRAWNERHIAASRLDCGKSTPDDSLFMIAFGIVTPHGTIPITLGIQLQRAGKSAATHVASLFMRAIAGYLR